MLAAMATAAADGAPFAACGRADLPTRALCGTVDVPYGPDPGDDRTTRIEVVRLPATEATGATPLVVIAGDPGSALDRWVGGLAATFDGVGATRDVIFVGARGTGAGGKDCPLYPSLEAMFGDLLPASAIAACQADGDRSGTTSALAVADLDAVRVALGIERIDLFADGPATRVALAYAAGNEDRVRALALRGAWPPDFNPTLAFAAAAQRAFDQLFVRCARNGPCRKAFDDVKRDFTRGLARLRKEPGSVIVTDPEMGHDATVTLGDDTFGTGLRLALDDPETYGRVPAAIAATAAGDLGPAAALILVVRQRLDDLDLGAHLDARCVEDGPDLATTDLVDATKLTYLGDGWARAYRDACALWAPAVAAPVEAPAIDLDMPTLLIAGEIDPWAVPAMSEAMLPGLANGRLVVLKGPAHGTEEAEACVGSLVAEFVATGSADGLDIACAQAAPALDFFIPDVTEP